MTIATLQIASRPREFVAVRGPDAVAFLDRMVTNAIEPVEIGASCAALLLTPKARIVAPLVVWRRGSDDLLLLTEPGLGTVVRGVLLRARMRSRCEIDLESHTSVVLLGADAGGIACPDFGVPAVELVDGGVPDGASPLADEELERLRILARTPRWGRELDDRVLPAEAGLEERAISFTKGCYPGQEPVARLHYRGRPNRALRLLALDGGDLPDYDLPLALGGREVGRLTSAARDPQHGIVALGYVRREVDDTASLSWSDGRSARLL